MTQPTSTSTRQLIEKEFGGAAIFADFVAKHRADGASWRAIAEMIGKEAGIWVSQETYRVWFTPALAEDGAA